MKFFKSLFITIIILSCLIPISYADDVSEEIAPIPVNTDLSDLNFEIFSRRAIVYERNSKCILFEKNIEKSVTNVKKIRCLLCKTFVMIFA